MVSAPRIIELPDNANPMRGKLTYIEKDNHIPFEIERTSWIYAVPEGEIIGNLAFKNREEFVIPLSGSLEIVLDDGNQTNNFLLNRANKGLYIPSNYWIKMENFSSNSIVLVLSSTHLSENDFVRNYGEFLKLRKI